MSCLFKTEHAFQDSDNPDRLLLQLETVYIRLYLAGFFFFYYILWFQGMKGKIDEYSDSDEDQHDAYLERMKAEGKIREEGNDSDDSDGSGSGKCLFHRLNT